MVVWVVHSSLPVQADPFEELRAVYQVVPGILLLIGALKGGEPEAGSERNGKAGGLGPCPPGLGRATFMAQLESTLEQATARLVAEARTKNQGSSST